MMANAAGYNRHNDGNNYLFADGHVKWLKNPPKGAFDYRTTTIYP